MHSLHQQSLYLNDMRRQTFPSNCNALNSKTQVIQAKDISLLNDKFLEFRVSYLIIIIANISFLLIYKRNFIKTEFIIFIKINFTRNLFITYIRINDRIIIG